MFYWPVVPVCDLQKRDVKPDDLLADGLYRKCNPITAGGGYDYFAKTINCAEQFVVQLYGCPLSCAYCYVTKDGIWGQPTMVSTKALLKAYSDSGCGVFHLMGGAPAIYLEYWRELYLELGEEFHSDFLLVEGDYNIGTLSAVRGTHAVSLKNPLEVGNYNLELALKNRWALEASGINHYYTITGDSALPDGFTDVSAYRIPIKVYKATGG